MWWLCTRTFVKNRPGGSGPGWASASAGVALGLWLTLEKPRRGCQLVLLRHWGLLRSCGSETPGASPRPEPSPLLHPPSTLGSSEQGMLFGPEPWVLKGVPAGWFLPTGGAVRPRETAGARSAEPRATPCLSPSTLPLWAQGSAPRTTPLRPPRPVQALRVWL